MSINKVVLAGNLTRDPEIRQTPGGTSVLSFGVAVNDRHRNQQTGEWEDRPNFVDCTMFGNRAAAVAPYLSKGSKVCVEGKLRWSQWERDGQRRSRLEVVLDEIELMSRHGDGSYHATGAQNGARKQQWSAADAYKSAPVPAASQVPVPEVYDSDIPF